MKSSHSDEDETANKKSKKSGENVSNKSKIVRQKSNKEKSESALSETSGVNDKENQKN